MLTLLELKISHHPLVTDVRIAHWPLVYSPIPTIVASIIYVWLVKSYGPRYMKNREPYDLKTVLVVYNALQVASSTFLFYQASLLFNPISIKSLTYVWQQLT